MALESGLVAQERDQSGDTVSDSSAGSRNGSNASGYWRLTGTITPSQECQKRGFNPWRPMSYLPRRLGCYQPAAATAATAAPGSTRTIDGVLRQQYRISL
ncbi:hypothetical protein MGN70_013501 [Eutypa lata]|nr:hypothetical protein MGN70_013501 [Eutypa lata]